MQILESEFIVTCDVDETLIMHNSSGIRALINPYSNEIVDFNAHTRHIDLIVQYRNRGYKVVVWSAAGYKWAQVVVEYLKKEFPKFDVDMVMTKPSKYIDDLETATEILGQRVYLK